MCRNQVRKKNFKRQYYEELEQVFNYLHKYHITFLLGDFNAKLGREDSFKPTIGNESLHQDCKDNVRIVNFATSKYLVAKAKMFPHRNLHSYIWTCRDRKTQNQIDDIFTDRRLHSNILDVQYFRGADCDTDHSLVVSKVKE